MPFQVEIKSNFDDHELSIEDCSMIIEDLQRMYSTIKSDFYTKFFNIKKLSKELVFVGILFVLYILTKELFFIYLMPISILIIMIFGCITIELTSKQIKIQIDKQIDHFKQIKQKLIKEKELV